MTRLIVIYLFGFFLQQCALLVTNETKDPMYGSLLVDVGYPLSGDIPVLNRKIFRGNRVSIREHPYIASIRRDFAHYCTGSILTKNLILTVAHPLIKVPIDELGVVVGENYSERGSTVHTVVLLIIHEDFDPYTLASDIALLRIYEDISYRGSVKPIGLIAPTDTLGNKHGFVTGWGRCDSTPREFCLPRTSKYFPDEKADPMLRSINFKIVVPNLYCEGYLKHDLNIKPGMLCLGPAREEDPVCPCMAVPGAPLAVKARLAGLLSWGFGCGYHHDLPLVYTDIRHYQPWLVHNIPILKKITKENLTRIFQATRGYILSQWLIETRLIRPQLPLSLDKNLVPTKLDKTIAKLRGIVYDIRDFVHDGLFHAKKEGMFEKLRKRANAVSATPIYVELHPFLNSNAVNYGVDNDTSSETD